MPYIIKGGPQERGEVEDHRDRRAILEPREDWELTNPNPSRLALWNRRCLLEEAIRYAHSLGFIPVDWYDELETRIRQYRRGS